MTRAEELIEAIVEGKLKSVPYKEVWSAQTKSVDSDGKGLLALVTPAVRSAKGTVTLDKAHYSRGYGTGYEFRLGHSLSRPENPDYSKGFLAWQDSPEGKKWDRKERSALRKIGKALKTAAVAAGYKYASDDLGTIVIWNAGHG